MKETIRFSVTASSKLQNKINVSIIFHYLRQNSPLYRAAISRNLGISAPAVSRVIDKLIRDKYIVEAEKIETKTGKRPTLLKINKDCAYIIVMDLGKASLKIALCNITGDIIKKFEGFPISNDSNIINELKNKIVSCMKQIGNSASVKAICLGIPADVDLLTGKIISAPLYDNWKDINFKKDINDEFNIPVYIENSVNLSALGEKYSGKGKDIKDIIFIEISNGIGAGIIINDYLYRGFSGAAGEIGFSVIDASNFKHSIAGNKYLEKLASLDSIKKKIISEVKNGRHSLLTEAVSGNIEGVEPSLIFEYAKKGDELSNEVIGDAINLLSVLIRNSALLLNPQLIIIGGDICNMPYIEDLLLKPLTKKIIGSIPFNGPIIELSTLGEEACLIGAAFIAMESLLSEEFPYKIE